MDPIKQSLRHIWDDPCSCTVCRQRLRSCNAEGCLGGHMFCPDCKLKFNECPVCSKAFNIEVHAAFKRVLQLLPHCCRYMGCSEVLYNVIRLEKHETWCGHRRTRCKLCGLLKREMDLYDHCSQRHFDIHDPPHVQELLLNLSKDEASVCLMSTCCQIFWVTYGIDRASADVYAQIVWVPNGSVNRNLFKAEVSFQVGSCKISVTIPIIHQHPTNASESNHLKVPLSELTSSRDMDGQSVRILVTVKA